MQENLTPMEKQALEARRMGKKVDAQQLKIPGQAPIVTLREFAGMAEAPMPVPPPAPEVAPEQPAFAPAPAAAAPEASKKFYSNAEAEPPQQVTKDDLEKLKATMFDEGKQPTPVDDVEAAAEHVGLYPKFCPRCFWDLKVATVNEPTKDDKLEFVESVLGNRRFTKEIPMLGGRMSAIFRTVTVEEEDAINEFIQVETAAKRITSTKDWSIWYTRCRMVVMLKRLTLDKTVRDFPEVSDKNYAPASEIKGDNSLRRALREVPSKWPLSIHGLLIQGMSQVDEIYTTLMSRSGDSSFWQGLTGE